MLKRAPDNSSEKVILWPCLGFFETHRKKVLKSPSKLTIAELVLFYVYGENPVVFMQAK